MFYINNIICNFVAGSAQQTSTGNKRGRPCNDEREEAFYLTTQFLEDNDDEQTTIIDLTDKMNNILQAMDSEDRAYSCKYMKQKKKEYYHRNQ